MLMGIGFISLGIFIYLQDNYDINNVNGERVVSKKKNIIKDRVYRYKALTSIFSIILGIFRILNSIIY